MLPTLHSFFCLCAKPRPLIDAGTCADCRWRKLRGLFVALPYEHKQVKHLVRQMKYEPAVRDTALIAAELVWHHIQLAEKAHLFEKSTLCPIPLDAKRHRRRGFNQAEVICHHLAELLPNAQYKNLLVKIKRTRPQAELRGKARRENLRGAFQVSSEKAILQGKIFLVDDVYTTGATMMEAVSTLHEVGIKNVWGVVLARSLPKS